jgi:ABC-type glycerol-3-phosphate transport system substrate-binding protein
MSLRVAGNESSVSECGKKMHRQMAMNAKTSHPDESWKLLTYMCGKEQGIVLGLSEGGGSATPGARRDVYTSDELKKAVPSIEWYAKQMEVAKPQWWAANLQTSNVWSTIGQGLSKIMLNPNPPVAADFHQLNSLAQSVLDQPMP